MRLSLCVAASAICLTVATARAADPEAATRPADLPSIFGPTDDRGTLFLAGPAIAADAWAPPLLFRELNRQALLMAARDGLGLYTRDEVLREFDPAHAVAPPGLRMTFDYDPPHGRCHSHTAALAGGGGTVDAAIPMNFVHDMLDDRFAAERAEEASRGWMPEALRHAGFAGAAVPADNDGPAPDGVDGLLCQTTLLAPLAAVQRTHAAVRQSGASPARLSSLARGYANLGQLTRFLWSTDRQVFAARSLLYGQRMVVRWPDRAISYWSRGYAEALAGLHAAALDDVARARQLQPAGAVVPPWAELIEPVCDYDAAALTTAIAADRERAPLAAFLTFLSVEQCGSTALVLQVGRATLRYNPACFHTVDRMTAMAGVGPGAELTEAALPLLAHALPADVGPLAEVPPDAAKAVAAVGTDPSTDALASAAAALSGATTVRAEPSLVTAGRLVQEAAFVGVERRAYFIAIRYGTDAGDFIRSARPLLAGHPFAAYVGSLALPAARRGPALRALAVDDVQEQMRDLVAAVAKVAPPPGVMGGSRLRNRVWQDTDPTAYDFAEALLPGSAKPMTFPLDVTDALLAYSPRCPMAAAARFRDHWDEPRVQAEADGWATKYAQQPATLRALAQRFADNGQTADAERALEQDGKIAGDYREAALLADLYLKDGDEAKWLATLEAAVRRPDYGLNHAQAQVRIAQHFMAKGDYRRAEPYADAAEGSKALWAMKCDADCHRGLGDTATADRIMKEARDHYGHE